MRKKLFIGFWILASALLFLYSYTQVDLSLTLSQASIYQTIEKSLQHIGYFNRPLSTYLYGAILIMLFFLYGWSLYLCAKKKIERRVVWLVIITMSIFLLFSYNAFSYDLFNYIFDAKIITHYHQNPYQHKALDYPGDPMLSFMRWTHRVYPYGPLWLLLTVPLSFLGFGYFLVTFFLFKALMVSAFIGTAYYIYKIAARTKIIDPTFALGFFALNPLVIIESLVSAHNDIVMIFFSLLGIYFLFEKKIVYSVLSLGVSAAIKFATGALLPLVVLLSVFKKRYETFFYTSLILMLVPLYYVIVRTTFQPWYMLYLIPFAAFVSKKFFILIPTFFISIFSLTQYIPYLYLGNWDPPVPQTLAQMSYAGIIFSVMGCLGYIIFRKVFKSL